MQLKGIRIIKMVASLIFFFFFFTLPAGNTIIKWNCDQKIITQVKAT